MQLFAGRDETKRKETHLKMWPRDFANLSTGTMLLTLLKLAIDSNASLNKGQFIVEEFVDFSKALKLVNCEMLLHEPGRFWIGSIG